MKDLSSLLSTVFSAANLTILASLQIMGPSLYLKMKNRPLTHSGPYLGMKCQRIHFLSLDIWVASPLPHRFIFPIRVVSVLVAE